MAYTIEFCNTPLAIPERRWGAADNVPAQGADTQPTVQFTAFSSCIGICARNENGSKVVGVHLSVLDGAGHPFAASDAATVVAILRGWGYDRLTAFVIGQTSVWQATAPAAYQALLTALGQPKVYSYGDGRYGAGLNQANVLVPTFADD